MWLRWSAAVAALASIIAGLWYSHAPLYAYHQSHHPNHAGHEQSAGDNFAHVLGVILWSLVDGIERHHDLWIVLETLALVLFTATLWRSTDKLWVAQNESHEATQRAFVFIDGFNFELTTAADGDDDRLEFLPDDYKKRPELYITRFAVQPRWKNGGATPTKNMTIQTNWRGPLGTIPPDYVYKNPATPFFIAPNAVEASDVFEVPEARRLTVSVI